ncbi:prolyl oligopeptidase family serine peptidase [Roseobacter sp. YSTF-M11]|uniref:Prolyl oligopeptidase family serine peptidase n=1 Tax=Roseobacter insulae TaxID=2859783 RepID=A0A9X1FXQ2_9RHOB|nr:prolyl oligopeptidase family serine peptidase [Roseobacter insulae]MBW4709626.1 prolyl oligopeptidase family serine peptidase [Roseobacter insulae]
MTRLLAALALTWLGWSGMAAAGCGDTADPCAIDMGEYHVRLPEGPIKGAILYIHGYGGSGAGALRPKDWVNTALDRGYVLIAPDGIPYAEGRGRGWSFIPGRQKLRDEPAFLAAVRDDAAARFGFDASRVLLSGFSIGGSMTSYMACQEPGAFAAYAPVAGGFWRPHPTACKGPVRLLHTHGWTDGTVPLEGRVLRGADATDPGALMQGDIFYTLRMWREVNACNQLRADRFVTRGSFMRRAWDRCAEGSALEFALFPGGHVVPDGWAEMMIDWYEGL